MTSRSKNPMRQSYKKREGFSLPAPFFQVVDFRLFFSWVQKENKHNFQLEIFY